MNSSTLQTFALTLLVGFVCLCTSAQQAMHPGYGNVSSSPTWAIPINTPAPRIVEFDKAPNDADKLALESYGLALLSYLPVNRYLALVPAGITQSQLQEFNITSVVEIPIEAKLSPHVQSSPAEAQTIWVSYLPQLTDQAQLLDQLRAIGISNATRRVNPRNIVEAQATDQQIANISQLESVVWIEPAPAEEELLNYESNQSTRVTSLTIPGIPNRNLRGRGVLVGMGDGGGPINHIDFEHRIENFASSGWGTNLKHAYLVAGMIAAAGNRDPLHAGPAPESLLYTERFSNILNNLNSFVDRGGVLTNNSYGSSGSFGVYSATSSWVDQQMRDYPELLHLFAAGNSGQTPVAPYPPGYGNVYGHYQSTKNLLTVGNMEHYDVIHSSSSKGPTQDGRIKPDICAIGRYVVSTRTNNKYTTGFSGTSFATPGVTGGLALLYERYRQLFNGNNPNASLLKALVCNTADDIGNTGPDYVYGWGRLNARRAVELLEAGTWETGLLNTGQNNQHTIAVPSGAAEIRVMVYWADAPAVPYAPIALVNDLDLTVTDPTSTTSFPWVLDRLVPSAPASQGVDRLNNIEQVVIANPTAGNYIVDVSGHNVPFGPQEYFLVYEMRMPGVTLTYPAGGESLAPNTTEYLRWDAAGLDQDVFTIEYSEDNGQNWIVITDTVPGTQNYYPWVLAPNFTDQGLIRITANSSGHTSQTLTPFTVAPVPANLALTVPCPGFIEVSWDSIPGATGYEIVMLDTFMKAVATTTNASAILAVDDPNKLHWVGVRSLYNSGVGRQCYAQPVTPNTGTICSWDNELALDTIIGPASSVGRQFTSTQFGIETIHAHIINRGGNDVADFEISYAVDGLTSSEIYTDTIRSGDTLMFQLTTPYDFSPTGSYTLEGAVNLVGDLHQGNDTIRSELEHLPNPVAVLPYSESFESATTSQVSHDDIGLPGIPCADFESSTDYGQLRSGVAGFVKTGTRAFTIDVGTFGLANTNLFTLTANLEDYAGDSLMMDFSIMHHGEMPSPNDKVWIRGSDTGDWVELLALDFWSWSPATYQTFSALPIGKMLQDSGQQLTSSFQVRFGQEAAMPATLIDAYSGYTLDDLVFYEPPHADAGTDSTICSLRPVTIGSVAAATGGVPPYSYQWSPSAGLNSDTVANPIAAPTMTTDYTLTITDANGLSATDVVTVQVVECVALEITALLQGPFNKVTGLMNDQLRSLALVPALEPYSALGYQHVGGGLETVTDSQFAVSGNDAVVDWVVIELRDPVDPRIVVATKSALLNRSGSVIPADGTELIFGNFTEGHYYVALKHRNHLGVMTKQPLSLGSLTEAIDFTKGPAICFGSNAQVELITNTWGLWAGNSNGDKDISYTAQTGDRSELSPLIGTDKTHVLHGYLQQDLNLDGSVKYIGKQNDRAIILRNVGGLLPETGITEQIP